MKLRQVFLLLFAAFTLSSCGRTCIKETETEKPNTQNPDTIAVNIAASPTTIQMNKSIVTAEVLDIQNDNDYNYTIIIKVIELTEDPAYPSFASNGYTYTLKPLYGYDEAGKLLKNEFNDGLLKIKTVKKGDKINGVISLGRDHKWYLENIIQ